MNNPNPMAEGDAPGYMPTIQVIALLKAAGKAEQIRRRADLDVRGHVTRPDPLDRAVSVELAAREILDANRFLIPL